MQLEGARFEGRGLLVVASTFALVGVVVLVFLAAVIGVGRLVGAGLVVVGSPGIVAFAVVLTREIACGGRVVAGRRIGEVAPEIVGPGAF